MVRDARRTARRAAAVDARGAGRAGAAAAAPRLCVRWDDAPRRWTVLRASSSSTTPGEPSTSVTPLLGEEDGALGTGGEGRANGRAEAHTNGAPPPSPAPSAPAAEDTLIRSLISVSVIVVAAACLVYSRAGAGHAVLGSLLKGSWASFALIFLSEIGDKTFFIAALLSLTGSKLAVFSGSLVALAGMSAISVAIGSAIMAMPSILSNEAARRAGEVVSAVILVMFGMKNLSRYVNAGSVFQLLRGRAAPGGAEAAAPSQIDEEMEDARKVVMEASGEEEALCYAEVDAGAGAAAEDACVARGEPGDALKQLGKAASLVFLAEWGDRSMLATVALSTSHAPLGVFFGATAGHAAATGLAVVGGALIGRYINERVITVTSGVLFIVFGVTTALGIF